MKTYSSTKRESSRRTLRRRIVGSVVIVSVVIGLGVFVLPRLVSGVLGLVWMPIDAVRVWLAESGDTLPMYIRDRNELIDEIRTLQTRIDTEQGTSLTIRRLEIENKQFRELLGAVGTERVLARVVARPNELPYDVIMLDQGKDDGVTPGAPVFSGRDQLVGVVSRVFQKTSFVTLVTTPGVSVTVYVVGPNIFTVAEGVGGGVMRVRVPQGIIINRGDLVLLPALDAGVLGEINEVVTTPTDPERNGYVTFGTPIQSMQYVSVGRDPVVTNTFDDAEAAVEQMVSDRLTVDVPPELLVEPYPTHGENGVATSSIPEGD